MALARADPRRRRPNGERNPSLREEAPMDLFTRSKRMAPFTTLALIAVVLLAGPALAAPISYDVDLNSDNQFGTLKQTDVTGCENNPTGTLACGPTAAVNSFVFLENVYPTIYGN